MFCLLVVLVKYWVQPSNWLERLLRGSLFVVSRLSPKSLGRRVHMSFFGLVYCFIACLSCPQPHILSYTPYTYRVYRVIAYSYSAGGTYTYHPHLILYSYSLFVMKVSLNTSQPTNQPATAWLVQCLYVISLGCCLDHRPSTTSLWRTIEQGFSGWMNLYIIYCTDEVIISVQYVVNCCNVVWCRTQHHEIYDSFLMISSSLTRYVTVSHGSAYTVVKATQQVNGKWQFWGVRTQ